VLLSSPECGVRTQARVVYCQPVENNRFAVGLELLPAGEWTSHTSSLLETFQKYICGRLWSLGLQTAFFR